MAKILIGTSGYSYHDWIWPVYPEGTKSKDYLACYSGIFPSQWIRRVYAITKKQYIITSIFFVLLVMAVHRQILQEEIFLISYIYYTVSGQFYKKNRKTA